MAEFMVAFFAGVFVDWHGFSGRSGLTGYSGSSGLTGYSGNSGSSGFAMTCIWL
jgi:hypothetical protein